VHSRRQRIKRPQNDISQLHDNNWTMRQ